MTPKNSFVEWRKSARIVPSRYPPAGVFERVADARDLEAVLAVEGLTNDRLRDELGEIQLVPQEDRISGAGTTPIMSAFTHPNPDGSRFSDGSFGVYYAGESLETAIAESCFHRERFLSFSSEPPIRLQMRTYYARVGGGFHDLRGAQKTHPEWFNPDPARYGASQALGAVLKAGGSNGVVYRSVRRPAGECLAVFRPHLISPVTQGPHFEYIWNGRAIADVLEIKRYTGRGG
ncbi:MAG: RES domain-containing protein [Xanthomonadales bacterium]|nr:RES domain-containing protein [Xanthomonadales bacterium]